MCWQRRTTADSFLRSRLEERRLDANHFHGHNYQRSHTSRGDGHGPADDWHTETAAFTAWNQVLSKVEFSLPAGDVEIDNIRAATSMQSGCTSAIFKTRQLTRKAVTGSQLIRSAAEQSVARTEVWPQPGNTSEATSRTRSRPSMESRSRLTLAGLGIHLPPDRTPSHSRAQPAKV